MWCLCHTHSAKWLNDLKFCAFLYMTASINILLQESFLSGTLCKIRLAFLLELVWTLALQASGYTSSRQEFFSGHFSQDPTISYWCNYQIMPDDIKTKPAAAIHALPQHREPIHLHVCHQLTFSCLLKGNDNMGLKRDLLALRKHLLNLGLLLSFSSFSNFLAFSTKESRKKKYRYWWQTPLTSFLILSGNKAWKLSFLTSFPWRTTWCSKSDNRESLHWFVHPEPGQCHRPWVFEEHCPLVT